MVLMWRRNVLFISLPSQPSSTNGLGTRACLMGSSNSPLVSKEAMQPWKPDFDSKGRGNVLYMWGRTPPAKNFNTIIVRKAVELEFDSTAHNRVAPFSKLLQIMLLRILVIPIGTTSYHPKNERASFHARLAKRAQSFTTILIKQNWCGLDYRSI